LNSKHRLRFLNAVQQSCGTGADVAVLDRNPEALRRVDAVLGNRVRMLFSTRDVVELLCPRADLVIATVLVPGSTTPKLIRAQVKAVKTGAMASFGTIEGPIRLLQFSDFGRCADAGFHAAFLSAVIGSTPIASVIAERRRTPTASLAALVRVPLRRFPLVKQ
jgi:hypothetical protein